MLREFFPKIPPEEIVGDSDTYHLPNLGGPSQKERLNHVGTPDGNTFLNFLAGQQGGEGAVDKYIASK